MVKSREGEERQLGGRRLNWTVFEKRIPVIFSHTSRSGQRAQSSSSASRALIQSDGRKSDKYGNLRGVSLSGLEGLPYASITNLNRAANSATNVCSETLRLSRPRTSRKSFWCESISCFAEGGFSLGLRVPKIQSHCRSLFHGRVENRDRITQISSRRLVTPKLVQYLHCRGARIRGRLRSVYAHTEQQRSSSGDWKLESPKPNRVGDGQW